MEWYQVFECDNTIPDLLVCDYDNLEDCGYTEQNFKIGKKIENWNNNVFFQARKKRNDGNNPDDVLQSATMLPIYSKRLIDALNRANIKGIQYLPVKILKFNGDDLKGFAIVNI